jgi:3-methyladenine DNA glycosylase AlkD
LVILWKTKGKRDLKVDKILEELRSLSNPKNVEGMARFGINPKNNLGVSVTTIRGLAKKIGKNHELANQLWKTGIRDARMLGASIDDPKLVTEEQLESWVADFNSWDICDHCCGHLFDKTQFAYKKVEEWSRREEEFVKRAGFALIAWLAVHDKKAADEDFEGFFSIITREAGDERNYVKKAVNWALRNVGKRNIYLNKKAIKTAKELKKMNSKSAKWIASDAIRELESEKVQERLLRKMKK